MTKAVTPWTDEELVELMADAMADAHDMGTGYNEFAKAILRDLAANGLHITWTPERLALLSNPA